MIEELNEGEPPKMAGNPRTERDASMWKILEISADEDPRVTFQAGAVTFTCYKSGLIYKAWQQEARRQAHHGSTVEKDPRGMEVVFVENVPYTPSDKGWQEQPVLPPVAGMVDSQIEEGELRIGKLRKKAALMNWCDHDKAICTGKCALLDEIRAIEKKILGDP